MIKYMVAFHVRLQLRCIFSNYNDHPQTMTWYPYISSRPKQLYFLLGEANAMFSCTTAALWMGECWFWGAILGVSLRRDV